MEGQETKKVTADVVLMDIEGTTTSIEFVKKTLFPYVVANVKEHLTENWTTEETKEDVRAIRQQMLKDGISSAVTSERKEEDNDNRATISDLCDYISQLVSADRKVPSLKQLQGNMWRKAYQNGQVKGHLYPDVVPCLKTWKSSGVKLATYSSGSVQAQKLLFRHSVDGDILGFFSAQFDTKTGAKGDKESYLQISKSLGTEPKNILFLTDVGAEVDAASAAGLQVILSDRPNVVIGPMATEGVHVITSFDQIEVVPLGKGGN